MGRTSRATEWIYGLFMDQTTLSRLMKLIEPYNRKGAAIGPDTKFTEDLELDSLTVMDLVANIEDEWDINIPLNMLPDLETVGQVADAVGKLKSA